MEKVIELNIDPDTVAIDEWVRLEQLLNTYFLIPNELLNQAPTKVTDTNLGCAGVAPDPKIAADTTIYDKEP